MTRCYRLLKALCGACVPACPVSAIFPEEDVPSEWESFIGKNYELSGL